ncbi:MAG: hypothetical protein C3F15_12575 [Holophagae bacterium]|nr:MAG: hypothetical protein C3F15_12575 [Holophagae bacterium]
MSRFSASAMVVVMLSLSAPVVADDGDPDSSFWGDGKLTISSYNDLTFASMASDPEGQLAVLYSFIPAGAVMTFTAWRSVGDSALGDPCVVDLSLIDPPSTFAVDDAYARDIAFDTYGRLLVLMRVDDEVGDTAHFVYAYDFPNCQLVATYGDGGVAQVLSWNNLDPSYCGRLRPLAEGPTMCVGSYFDALNLAVLVKVIQPDGSMGQAYFAPADTFPSNPSGKDVAVAANDHVVVAADASSGQQDFFVVDFAPDGTVAGALTVPFDLGGSDADHPRSIAAIADGRIVIVGNAAYAAHSTSAAVAMLRWNAQGVLELDPSFGSAGKLDFLFDGHEVSALEDVRAQGDGKIVVAGLAQVDYLFNKDMAVARLAPDGDFDRDFGPPGTGQLVIGFDEGSPNHDVAYRVDLQNGRAVLGGSVDVAGSLAAIGVVRLLNDYVFGDGFEVPHAPGWLWVY